eukprot:jgi/Orpsp1_1/1190271/evm.model.d7180000077855.2
MIPLNVNTQYSTKLPPILTTSTTTTTTEDPLTIASIITTTNPTTLPTKCIPVTVTVTEKEKKTITEKETVTVTIKSMMDPNEELCAAKWTQCGGVGYKGPTCCQSGSTCKELNKYYSQCV